MSNSDYGALAANTRFLSSGGGGGEDFIYLALRDHPGPSGVPLGGIGVGCIGLAPDGRFTRVAINNTFRPLPDEHTRGCFFAVWQGAEEPVARRLARDSALLCGMSGFAHTSYRGLFPTVSVSFDEARAPGMLLRVSLQAFSGLIPHNVKDSALPVVHFAVHLVNTYRKPLEAAAAFSWEDLIGRGLMDAPDPERLPKLAHWKLADEFTATLRAPTEVEPYALGRWKGLRQFALEPLVPKRATFQNYVSEVALLAETGAGSTLSCLPRYVLSAGEPAWASFRARGVLDSARGSSRAAPDGPATAAAVAVRARVPPADTRTFRFILAWHMPELKPDPATAHPRSYWPGCDYGRFYHRDFGGLRPLAEYAARQRERVEREVAAWQRPILESTLPDWLKFKLINSAYTLYPQTILNKDGAFTVMEGEMGGLTGTMDQRLSAHPVYQKLFTALDRSEMQMFADAAGRDGNILHFSGNYFFGVPAPGGSSPAPQGWMLDNTASWIIQLAKDYAQTGDRGYLERNARGARRGLAFLKARIAGDTDIPVGPTTYDDYPHPPIYCYTAGVYLATLRAGAYLARALGDRKLARECDGQFARTQRSFIRLLWNGRFFSYGCEPDGTRRRDHLVFTGQLAGQFVSRYCGWGDVAPPEMARAALVAQFKCNLAHAPDYYGNKIFDLDLNAGVDMPGSQCWPFYLESYTAMAAIQAGYVEDGLEIMRRVQLVHLRRGYTWCQNLWNPGPVTYMTAPVTWFITDVLAGAGLDVPGETLFLAPVRMPGQRRTRLPLYFPRFWAELDYAPEDRRAVLRVLKTFGEPVLVRRLASEPAGTPAGRHKTAAIKPVALEAGAELDLSRHWRMLFGSVQYPAILPRAGEVEFLVYRPGSGRAARSRS